MPTGAFLPKTLLRGAALLAIACWFDAHAEAGPFDGRWSVVLVCDDTTDRNGPVKGYVYRFPVSIADGVIEGRNGSPDTPGSVRYSGTVASDGALEIVASGATGQPDYSVGRVARGTNYGYTLHGRLVGSTGEATRRELRPCRATFTRS